MSQPTQAQVEPEVLHAEAVKALLEATNFTVYLSSAEIPDQPEWPHLVAWGAAGDPIAADERMAGYAGAVITRHHITIAALTAMDAIGAAARVRRLLHRKRPAISGRRCGDMTHLPGPPAIPVVDPDVTGPHGQRIHVLHVIYTLTSTLGGPSG